MKSFLSKNILVNWNGIGRIKNTAVLSIRENRLAPFAHAYAQC